MAGRTRPFSVVALDDDLRAVDIAGLWTAGIKTKFFVDFAPLQVTTPVLHSLQFGFHLTLLMSHFLRKGGVSMAVQVQMFVCTRQLAASGICLSSEQR